MTQLPPPIDVYVAGRDGYHTYRIPALTVTPRGHLLAFCEGRRGGSGDAGEIDLLVKRSEDGGRTWSAQTLVWKDGPNTCGNPCPVVDRATGVIWLPLTHNLGRDTEPQIIDRTAIGTRTVWVTSSEDDGLSWAPPRDITAMAKDPDWTWYATGPGAGIQTRDRRLVIPCDHMVAGTKAMGAHALISDDHGQTWRLGGRLAPYLNECQVAERQDGSLLLNMRSYDPAHPHQRKSSVSRDGGETWSAPQPEPTLVEPVCQAGLVASGDGRMLFSNPASTERVRMTVRLSEDDGRTWPRERLLHAGPAAYSCLAMLPDGDAACLYEAGEQHPYERIVLATFPLDAIG